MPLHLDPIFLWGCELICKFPRLLSKHQMSPRTHTQTYWRFILIGVPLSIEGPQKGWQRLKGALHSTNASWVPWMYFRMTGWDLTGQLLVDGNCIECQASAKLLMPIHVLIQLTLLAFLSMNKACLSRLAGASSMWNTSGMSCSLSQTQHRWHHPFVQKMS